MRKTWGRLFSRRESIAEKLLEEDFPTTYDSDITDDDRQRQRWQEHLTRRSTIADTPDTVSVAGEEGAESEYEYSSEFSVNFPSETSIIDAYKETTTPSDHLYYVDNEFEQFKQDADDDGFVYGNRKTFRPRANTLIRNDQVRKKSLAALKLPDVGKQVKDSESLGSRQSNVVQSNIGPKTNSKQRYATWNHEATEKTKPRTYTRKRRRVGRFTQEDSDDDGKFTVNLTMEDLNSIIKKNINSAVKTIVSAAKKDADMHVKKSLSHSESFSTETETFFSGSSSHSTEIPAGLLHKQIKAQLDRDRLKGTSRVTTVASQQRSVTDQIADLQEDIIKISEHIKESSTKERKEHERNECGNERYQQLQHHQQPPTPAPLPHSQHQQQPPPPPPPPPHPPTSMPQVTFSLPNSSVIHESSSPMFEHQNMYRRQSLSPGMNPYADIGSSFNTSQLGDAGMASGSFGFNGDIAMMAARLQNRRHTLASIDNEVLLSSLNSSMDKRLDNFTKALEKLNKQQQSDCEDAISTYSQKASKKPSVKKENKQERIETPDPLEQVPTSLVPVLSISDQIAALSKKKKKPLKPGQIPMSTCARSCLILTNIIFLIIGSGTVALGVWMKLDPNINTYFELLDVDRTSQSFTTVCYALCAIGGFVATVAFTGCCGGIQSSKCLLTVFLVFISVIVVIETGLGLIVFVNMDSPAAIPILSALFAKLEDSLKSKLKYSLVHHYIKDTLVGTTWDNIQTHMECCGATGYEDYASSQWKNDTLNELIIPDTCCKLVTKDTLEPEPSNRLLCQAITIGFYHNTGCYDRLVGWFHTNSTYILGAAGAVLAVEIFSFIFALVICRKAKKVEKKENEEQNQHNRK